jgi:hypothetical protein
MLELGVMAILPICVDNTVKREVKRAPFIVKVERRYGRKRAAIAAGRGAHLHTNCSFSPPPALMAMKLPTIGGHI